MLNGVDIFCTVIDNFGDIGVCWRLAQQLQDEYGLNVRLWVDDLNSFAKLEPTLNPQLAQQTCQKIEICYWSKSDFWIPLLNLMMSLLKALAAVCQIAFYKQWHNKHRHPFGLI